MNTQLPMEPAIFGDRQARNHLTGNDGGTSLHQKYSLAETHEDAGLAQHSLRSGASMSLKEAVKTDATHYFARELKEFDIGREVLKGAMSLYLPGDSVVEISRGSSQKEYFPAERLLIQANRHDPSDPASASTLSLVSLRVPSAPTARAFLEPLRFQKEIQDIKSDGRIQFEHQNQDRLGQIRDDSLPGCRVTLSTHNFSSGESVTLTIHSTAFSFGARREAPALLFERDTYSSCWERTLSCAPGFEMKTTGSLPREIKSLFYTLGEGLEEAARYPDQNPLGVAEHARAEGIWAAFDPRLKKTSLFFEVKDGDRLPLQKMAELLPEMKTEIINAAGKEMCVVHLTREKSRDPAAGPLRIVDYLVEERHRGRL